ncbi:MAG: 4Fe-4S dicluster domain-containing protein [Chloroflexota bacterium]
MSDELNELVKELALAEKVRYCFQCGTCVGGCPVAGAEPRYNPRRMLEAVARGEGEAVVRSDDLWLCTLCHTCLERCPQGVSVSHIFTRLKGVAAALGHVPDSLVAELKAINDTGRVIPLSAPIERRRAQLGLPPLVLDGGLAELRQLIAATGLRNILMAEDEPAKENG